MDVQTLYGLTAKCRDLPELEERDGPWALLNRDPAIVADAVGERQTLGGRCEEKIDGCFCAVEVDEDGKLRNPTSRKRKPLKQAIRWSGVEVGARLAGWTLVGEVYCGTTRAMHARQERREDLSDERREPFYVYSAVSPSGEIVTGDQCALLVAALGVDRLQPVPYALPGESWKEFTRSVFQAGGEGVVIRTPEGDCYRAKAHLEIDMVVMRRFAEKDRNGGRIEKLDVGYCVSAGKRARFARVQTILMPAREWLDANGLIPGDFKRRTVVSVLGSDVTDEGVIRHARITELRTDKPARECRPPSGRR